MTSSQIPAPDAPAAARLLVVDDEQNIRDLLSETFRLVGYDVTAAATGADALNAATTSPDLVVLDVMLPDLDGYEVARLLRRGGREIPVLFLTARDTVRDRVEGLSAGGDDYVTKPFSLEEVVLRVRAILRRTRHREEPAADPVLRCAGLELDEAAHTVLCDGREMELSPTEFRMLAYLMENAGRVVSKAQILERVWGYDFGGDTRIVETYIHYLRRKIDRDGAAALIHTLRGVGYVLRAPK